MLIDDFTAGPYSSPTLPQNVPSADPQNTRVEHHEASLSKDHVIGGSRRIILTSRQGNQQVKFAHVSIGNGNLTLCDETSLVTQMQLGYGNGSFANPGGAPLNLDLTGLMGFRFNFLAIDRADRLSILVSALTNAGKSFQGNTARVPQTPFVNSVFSIDLPFKDIKNNQGSLTGIIDTFFIQCNPPGILDGLSYAIQKIELF